MAKVEVLQEIEHIRLRPTMYIGNPETPIHLVTEVLDNALDELVNGYTNRIDVNINSNDKIIAISDYGRGIPIHDIKLPDGSKQDSIVTIATKLFSSAKFDRSAYDIAIGQNGVGLVVVNALSEYMVIITKFKNKHKKYIFKNGEFINSEVIPKQPFSTYVEFKPNMQYFEKWLNEEDIVNRLKLVKVHYPSATIFYNDNQIENIDYNEFVRHVLDLDDNTPIFTVKGKVGKETIEISFTYEMSEKAKLQPVILGDVNLKLAEGRYISTIQSTIANIVDSIKPKHYVITKQDALIRFRAYVSLLLKEPRFDSQNKTRLISDVKYLVKKVENQLAALYKKEEYLKHALDKINEYRILKDLSKKTSKSLSRKKLSTGNPVKMSKKPGTLYIVEGLSAAGTLTQIRDVNYEAVFPLKGKIINVQTNTLDKVLNNKEVKYLLETLGISVGNPSNSTIFDKVVVLADPDADAHHIILLVLLVLYKFAKQYIEEGKVYIIIPPLYAYKENGKLILHKSFKPPANKQYIRYKGLGEMNPEELEKVIRDDYFYLQVPIPDNESELFRIVTDTVYKRQLLNLDKDVFELLED